MGLTTIQGFYLDLSRCTACGTCAVACKDWNNLEVGVSWRKVASLEYYMYPKVKVLNFSFSCMHCGKPPCVKTCPTGALFKRTEDGIVIVKRDKCIGCRQCLTSCPFSIPQFGRDGKMQKCDFCIDRVKSGLNPICVDACPMRALYAGPIGKILEIAHGKAVQRMVKDIDPSFIFTYR